MVATVITASLDDVEAQQLSDAKRSDSRATPEASANDEPEPDFYFRFGLGLLSPFDEPVDDVGSVILFEAEAGFWRPWFQVGMVGAIASAGSCAFCLPVGQKTMLPLGVTAAIGPIDTGPWGGGVRMRYRTFTGETSRIHHLGAGLSLWRHWRSPAGNRFSVSSDLMFETWLNDGEAVPGIGLVIGIGGAGSVAKNRQQHQRGTMP
jgi:hypothetical protein